MIGAMPLPLWVGEDALTALAGERDRVLAGALGDRDALQRDRQARAVHHGEHAGEPAIFLAEQPPERAAAVAVDHRAGRARVDAELVLEAAAADVVAGAVGQHFRHQEQRDSARPLRCVGQSRQNEVDDVVGEIVLAVADEDLLAGDTIAAVPARLRPGADGAEIRARLRLGQIHRRRPLAGDELAQIPLLEVFAPVRGDRFHAAEGQERGHAKSEARAVPHLEAAGIEQLRQTLSAVFGRTGQRVPTGGGPGLVGLLEARCRGDDAVAQLRAMAIAGPVDRRQHLPAEPRRFLQNILDHVES